MLKKTNVSVIIPTYNQKQEYLDCAIKSALNQIHKPYEIIVVNDGGNAIIPIEHPLVYYFEKEENGGTASALNYGINEASGDYISWLSSDDFFYPHFLSSHIMNLVHFKNETLISYCGFSEIVVDDYGNELSVKDYKPPFENNIRGPYGIFSKDWHSHLLMNLSQTSCQFNGCCFLIHKSIINDIGEFDINNKFTQDFQYWLRVSKKYNLAVLPQILLCRREHRGRTQFVWNKEEFMVQREKEMKDMKNTYLFH